MSIALGAHSPGTTLSEILGANDYIYPSTFPPEVIGTKDYPRTNLPEIVCTLNLPSPSPSLSAPTLLVQIYPKSR
eukprot:1819905-Rhodomonas_salina.1